MKTILTTISALIFAFRSYCSPLEEKRYWALGMIESGNNDHAVGKDGEVSRYQIRPIEIAVYAGGLRYGDLNNPVIARGVAVKLMSARLAKFRKNYSAGREPTDLEWCLLWHKPSHILTNFPPPYTKSEADYAIRFANLVHRR